MAFERLQELGERAARRMQHGRRSVSSSGDDPDDPFGKPPVVEIALFEEQPVVHRRTIAKERIGLAVTEVVDVETITAERRVEHIEMDGNQHG